MAQFSSRAWLQGVDPVRQVGNVGRWQDGDVAVDRIGVLGRADDEEVVEPEDLGSVADCPGDLRGFAELISKPRRRPRVRTRRSSSPPP